MAKSYSGALPFESEDEPPPPTSRTKTYSSKGKGRAPRTNREENAEMEEQSGEEEQAEDEGEDEEPERDADMWDAVRILKQKNKMYLIEWEGTDPDTGKPWAPTWEVRANCTDILMAEWEMLKAKKADEAKSKKKLSGLNPSGKKRSPSGTPQPKNGGKRKRESISSSAIPTSPKRTRKSFSIDSKPKLSPPKREPTLSSVASTSSKRIRSSFQLGEDQPSPSRFTSKPISKTKSYPKPSSSTLAKPVDHPTDETSIPTGVPIKPTTSSNTAETSLQAIEATSPYKPLSSVPAGLNFKRKPKPPSPVKAVENAPDVGMGETGTGQGLDLTRLPGGSVVEPPSALSTTVDQTIDLSRDTPHPIPLTTATSVTNPPRPTRAQPHTASDHQPPSECVYGIPASIPSGGPSENQTRGHVLGKNVPKDASELVPAPSDPSPSRPVFNLRAGFPPQNHTSIPPNVPSFPFSVPAPKASSVFAATPGKDFSSRPPTAVPSSLFPLPSERVYFPPSSSTSVAAPAKVTPVTLPSSKPGPGPVQAAGPSHGKGKEPMSSQIEDFTQPDQHSSQSSYAPLHRPRTGPVPAGQADQSESILDFTASTIDVSTLPGEPVLSPQSSSRPINPLPRPRLSSHKPPPTFRAQSTTPHIEPAVVQNETPATSVTAPAPLKPLSALGFATMRGLNLQAANQAIVEDSKSPVEAPSQPSAPVTDEDEEMSVESPEDIDDPDVISIPFAERPIASETTPQTHALEADLAKAIQEKESLREQNDSLQEQNTVLKNRVKATEDDNDFIKEQYRTSSDRAVTAARELQEAEATVSKLQSQLKLGIQQVHLFYQSQVQGLTKQVAQLQAQKELLLQQAERTDDEVRTRAARAPVLEQEVERLEIELEQEREETDATLATNEKLKEQLWKARAPRKVLRQEPGSEGTLEMESDREMATVSSADEYQDSQTGQPVAGPSRMTARQATATAVTSTIFTNGIDPTTLQPQRQQQQQRPDSSPSTSSNIDLTMVYEGSTNGSNLPLSPPSQATRGLEMAGPLFLRESSSISADLMDNRDETESLEPELFAGIIPSEPDGSLLDLAEEMEVLPEPLPERVFRCLWQSADGGSCNVLFPTRQRLMTHMSDHGISLL